jgi:hypothetical protein
MNKIVEAASRKIVFYLDDVAILECHQKSLLWIIFIKLLGLILG